jgi:hypothetical protein
LGEGIYHFLFDIPKARLAFALKKLSNGATDPHLNLVVRINKRQLKTPGKLPPDGGLPGAGKTN